ncbi:hypothetical protein FB451DRAFT_1420669 [Mycena latifolia]|nr:hypothetical protein FB451DRAFT_1420669 [Mycena latifolia]
MLTFVFYAPRRGRNSSPVVFPPLPIFPCFALTRSLRPLAALRDGLAGVSAGLWCVHSSVLAMALLASLQDPTKH